MEIEWYEWTTQMYKQGKRGNILYSAVGGGGGGHFIMAIIFWPPLPPTTTTSSFIDQKFYVV